MMDNAFQNIQPFCSRLATKYSSEDLNNLKIALKSFNKDSFESLQEYIIFPIQLNLFKEKNSNAIIECINFLDFVFQTTSIKSWKTFWGILEQVMYFIISTPRNIQDPSEELIETVCECVVSMFLKSEEEILLQFYSVNYSPIIAQYLHGLLTLLKEKKSKLLRLNVLNCFAVMLYCHEDLVRTTSVKNKAREIVTAFLPGVSIVLRNIICGDHKQGYKIFEKSINLFGELISLTLEDGTLVKEAKDEPDITLPDELRKSLPCIVRNEEWANKTASKLSIIFENMYVILSHKHWKVRFATVKFIETIFVNCASNLEICILTLLQMLFALSVDSYEEVSNYSQNTIKLCMTKKKLKTLNLVLKQDLDLICSKLISIHMAINDEQKLYLLKTVHGYLQILGPSVNTLLHSFHHLDKFCKTMLKLIQFNTSNIIFLEQNFTSLDINADIPKLWPKKSFKYFHDDEVTSQVISIFYIMGFYGDTELLIDYFLEKFHELEYKNESLFLILSVIASLSEKQYSRHVFLDISDKKSHRAIHKFKMNLICNVIDEFLEDFEINNDENQFVELDNHNANILRICLILEGFSGCAEVLEIEFRSLLMRILCPIMEKAGNSITVVSESGKLALCAIALHCQYFSIAELITENVDYLINSITIGFCHFLQKSEMAIVLKVALELAKSDILLMFKDPLNQLLSCLDHNQEKAIRVMRILSSVVCAIKQWFIDSSEPKKLKDSSNDVDLKTYLLERHNLKKIVDEVDTDIDADECKNIDESEISENITEAVNYDDKKPPLFHVKVISDILERCIHYQSSENLQLCVLTLSIIDNSILALRNDIDRILPYIHKIWKPLVPRFSDNLIVMKKAFETLIIISNECGDFVKSRTMKEVWPKLLNFLKAQENVYRGKKNNVDYYLSSSYKFLLVLLSEIGNLASNLELTEKEFELLVWGCLPFIKQNQPRTLQKAALKTLESLINIDPDAFWFYYNELYGTTENIIPLNSSLHEVHFVVSETNTVMKHNLPV